MRIERRFWPARVMALVLGLVWPSLVVAQETSDEVAGPALVIAGDRPTRAPAHPDCDHRMPLHEHEVQPGEHLGLIAGRYGVRRTELIALNPQLSSPDLIHPGDKVRVCPEIFPRLTKRIEHEVKPGETLGAIAKRHGLSLAALVEMQGEALTDPNLVRVGQRLEILVDGGLVPDFRPPARPPARTGAGGKARGKRRVSVRLPASDRLHVKRPKLAYGTRKTIDLLQRAVSRYHRRYRGAPKVVVGDISRQGGGHLKGHLSHRTGRDVDLGYVLRGERATQTRFSAVTDKTLDLARTWGLLKAFLDTRQVVYIFVDYRLQKLLYDHAKAQGVSQRELDELFQYPHGRGRAHGIIRHWPSHRNHFHVRFRS